MVIIESIETEERGPRPAGLPQAWVSLLVKKDLLAEIMILADREKKSTNETLQELVKNGLKGPVGKSDSSYELTSEFSKREPRPKVNRYKGQVRPVAKLVKRLEKENERKRVK